MSPTSIRGTTYCESPSIERSKIALMHLLRGVVAESTVGSAPVVVNPPDFDQQLGISQTVEPRGTDTFVPKVRTNAPVVSEACKRMRSC